MNAKRWLERQRRYKERISDALKRMDDPTLEDLAHRVGIDNLPGPSAAMGVGRSSVGTHSDPTANAALNEVQTDLVDQWLRDLETEMRKAAHHVSVADHLRSMILDLRRQLDRSVPKPGAGDCLACGRWVTGEEHDRIKAGFGPECYTAWIREGKPDRMAFIAARRARVEGDQRRNVAS